MSLEDLNKKVEVRFSTFTELDKPRKSYPNILNKHIPESGMWANLKGVEIVKRDIASLGVNPCVRMTGVIVIEIFSHLNIGTRGMAIMFDKIDSHFGMWTDGNLWTDPARTTNEYYQNKAYWQNTVYVPFTYDEG